MQSFLNQSSRILCLLFCLSPVLLVAAPQRPPRKTNSATAETSAITVIIEGQSTASAAARQALPSSYRSMSPDALSGELGRLRLAAGKLAPGTSERIRLDELIHAVEMYEKTGVDPNALLEEITAKVAEARGLKPTGHCAFPHT